MSDRSTEGRATGWTASADDFETILRFAADPITVQGPDGRLVYANEAAARQVGYDTADAFLAAPIDEVMGRYDLIDESGRPFPLDALPGRRALRGDTESTALVGFRGRDRQEERWAVVTATPIVRGGSVQYVINAFQDVTDRKRTEDRLRMLADAGAVLAATPDYEATMPALAEIVVPALADWCVVDIVEGSGVHRAAIAHPDPVKQQVAAEIERRYPPDPAGSGAVAQVIRSGDAMILPEVTEAALAAAARDDEHLSLLRQLGLRSVAILPLTARGQVLGALTLARGGSGHRYDEDDRPFLEDLGRRAAVAIDNARLLRESNDAVRLRDDFLAMASHDMRTPLQAILGNVQLAQRRLARGSGGEAPAEVVRNLDNAERTTGKLARLVSELMDVAMLRSGQSLPMESTEFDLVDVARDIAEGHRARTDRHTIEITGTPALRGRWDLGRVERVLDNLVDNAVKYSPAGGSVTIDVAAESGAALIEVRDEGIGIPAAELPTIFQPYRRGSNVRTLRGIGLGLAGCRAVLEQLGGDLTVESTEGAGSTFRVRLPLDAEGSG